MTTRRERGRGRVTAPVHAMPDQADRVEPAAVPRDAAPSSRVIRIEGVRVEQRRHDQTQCPHCGAWGCPATRGSYATAIGRVRYRQCSACEFVFQTVKPHDGGPERVIL